MHGTACVGRDHELSTLEAALDRAGDGAATVVLVSGEPGIGKSRLLDEAAARARGRGFRVLAGYALDAAGLPALFPLRGALAGALSTEVDARDREAARRLAVLAAAGLADAPEDLPPPAPLAAEAERLRLGEAFASALVALTKSAPVLLSLDDMQWADGQAWQLLVYAARRFATARLVLLLALRDDALADPRSAAARAVVDLNRLRLLAHLPLGPLAVDAVAQLVERTLGAPPDEPLASAIAVRSGGNPFFVEELSRALVGRAPSRAGTDDGSLGPVEGASLLLTLRLAIRQRLDRLPEETCRILAAGAALGRYIDLALLADVLACDRDQLDAALAPAFADGLLRLEGVRAVFTHDVIREALQQDGAHGRRLHAAIAVALADRISDQSDADSLAALADHWAWAGETLPSGHAALAAAEALLVARRPVEAARQARRAIESLPRVTGVDPTLRARAGLALGRASLATGEFAQCEASLRSALIEASSADDGLLRGSISLELGRLLRRREQHDAAVRSLQAALDSFAANDPRCEDLVETLIELTGVEGMSRGRYAEAAAYGERALDLARDRGSPALEARAALAIADARGRAGEPAAVRPLLELAAARAMAAGDLASGIEACASLANVCYWTGDLRASERYAEQRLALAEESADPFALRHAHAWLALLAWTRGDLASASSLLAAAQRHLQHIDSPEPVAFAQLIAGMIAFRRGEMATACATIGAAIDLFATVDDATPIWYAGWQALALIAAGRHDEARACIDAQERRLAALPVSALPARSARNTLALAYVALGDRAGAARCEAALFDFPDDFHWSPVRRTLALLAALRGDRAAALRQLIEAERHARAQALLPELALTLYARADLLAPADPARERLRREADAIARRLALCFPERGPMETTARRADGLSPREVEVLRLVAQGRTNREIADQLVLSERTVINHIRHIFTKIDAPNRTAAAAYALRHGLD